MRRIITLDEVNGVRERIARARTLAAERFRDAFAAGAVKPEAHLPIQAAALLEVAEGTTADGPVEYEIRGRDVTPLFPELHVDRDPAAIFEWFMISSELYASPTWSVTKLIATPDEFDVALGRMQHPQIVHATFVSFLPAVDAAMLEVTLHSRAGEERIERRHLVLDENNEFHFHSRDLVAEGRGGVKV